MRRHTSALHSYNLFCIGMRGCFLCVRRAETASPSLSTSELWFYLVRISLLLSCKGSALLP